MKTPIIKSSLTFPARLAVYRGPGAQVRVYAELDEEFCRKYLAHFPGYIEPYPLKKHGGSLGLRPMAFSGLSLRRPPGVPWTVDISGVHGASSGKYSSLFKALGPAEYGLSRTTARYYPRTGVIQIQAPPLSSRQPVGHRGSLGTGCGGKQLTLDL